MIVVDILRCAPRVGTVAHLALDLSGRNYQTTLINMTRATVLFLALLVSEFALANVNVS